MFKGHKVQGSINADYYERVRAYVKEICMALTGTCIYICITGKINLNAPPGAFLLTFFAIFILLLMFKSLYNPHTIILFKPSNFKYRKEISTWVDIPLKLSIGLACTALSDFSFGPEKFSPDSFKFFVIFYCLFLLLLGVFSYCTINIPEENERSE